MATYSEQFLRETKEIIDTIDLKAIENMSELLLDLRNRDGRLFFLGVGGSAANASHAVNDFRKIVGIEAYTPSDNVSELTARVNDEGWDTVFSRWLQGSRLKKSDMLFILSVGGGNLEHKISVNLIKAVQYAKNIGCRVIGVVGRDGGYTAETADNCVVIPTVNSETVTPHTEAFQAVICHLLVSHPRLQVNKAKWESALSI